MFPEEVVNAAKASVLDEISAVLKADIQAAAAAAAAASKPSKG